MTIANAEQVSESKPKCAKALSYCKPAKNANDDYLNVFYDMQLLLLIHKYFI